METGRDDAWRDQFVEVADRARAGGVSSFYSAIARGELVRICPGVALPRDLWAPLDRDARFRVRIHATRRRFVDAGPASHLSAAALWTLPAIAPWPDRPEVLVATSRGGGSVRGLVRHAHGVPTRLEVIDGVEVTTLARTVRDAASVLPFSGGVAMADHALREAGHRDSLLKGRLEPEELKWEGEVAGARPGAARARRVIEFADARSGSPGESALRVLVRALGFPDPELQVEFRDAAGLIGYVDFWWPEVGLIVEFDGMTKYSDPTMRGGRSPVQVVIDEKIREDRLRALGPRILRLVWDDLRVPESLARRLEIAGLRARRRFSSARS